MDYALLSFDGHHAAHCATRQQHLRILHLTAQAQVAIRKASGAGRPQGRFEDI